jgi:adenylate kinase
MRLVLIGPPGSGKGTQAKLLCQQYSLEHISTGDLLRAAIRLSTPTGLLAKPSMDQGKLVPDSLVNEMVAEHFRAGRVPAAGFVMDGYPRTVEQAKVFDALLAELRLPLTRVLLLLVPDEVLVRRICGRWSCPNLACQATYHVDSKPPKVPGICDECKTPLVQRADDREDKVRPRLAAYHNQTEELIPYYKERGLLREVDGLGNIKDIYAQLVKLL